MTMSRAWSISPNPTSMTERQTLVIPAQNLATQFNMVAGRLDTLRTSLNESLTSVEAAERLRAAGVDPRRNPERLDAVAAQILLQEALDRPPGD